MNLKVVTGKCCSFFWHRKIEINEDLKQKLRKTIEELIVVCNVSTFLFGSRSNFDCLCHLVVTEVKGKYPNIKRVAYTCRGETCVLESARQEWERIYANLEGKEKYLLGVEEEVEHKTKYMSGRTSYVERNQAMINDSDYCVFYFDKTYMPEVRKYSKHGFGCYQPKSGTSISYTYAKKRNKDIINLFSELK